MNTWVIVPSDSDIIHGRFKYIEKVRTTKGGWRYIYKRPKYKTNAKNSFGVEERKKWKQKQDETKAAQEKHSETLRQNEVARKHRLMTGTEQDKSVSTTRVNESRQNVRNAELAEDRAEQNYRTTTLGKMEYSAKAAGEIISDFLKTFPKMANTKISYLINGSQSKIWTHATDRWKSGTPYNPPYNKTEASKTSVENNKKSIILPYNEIPVVTPKKKKKRIQG